MVGVCHMITSCFLDSSGMLQECSRSKLGLQGVCPGALKNATQGQSCVTLIKELGTIIGKSEWLTEKVYNYTQNSYYCTTFLQNSETFPFCFWPDSVQLLASEQPGSYLEQESACPEQP